MKIPKHKIKLNRDEQRALYNVIVNLQLLYDVSIIDSPHHKLLKEHLILFDAMLLDMFLNEKKTLSLDNAQALAFMQVWEGWSIRTDTYFANLLRRIIGEIDQKSKSAAAIAEAIRNALNK